MTRFLQKYLQEMALGGAVTVAALLLYLLRACAASLRQRGVSLVGLVSAMACRHALVSLVQWHQPEAARLGRTKL
jgi:hypothetical protein